MSDELFVDPEQLSFKARPYRVAASDWHGLGSTLDSIRSRYYGAWGDDDLGNKFGPSFDEGLVNVTESTKYVGDSLLFHGNGLSQSSEIYGEAGEDANETSRRYLLENEGIAAPKFVRSVRPTEAQGTVALARATTERMPTAGDPPTNLLQPTNLTRAVRVEGPIAGDPPANLVRARIADTMPIAGDPSATPGWTIDRANAGSHVLPAETPYRGEPALRPTEDRAVRHLDED